MKEHSSVILVSFLVSFGANANELLIEECEAKMIASSVVMAHRQSGTDKIEITNLDKSGALADVIESAYEMPIYEHKITKKHAVEYFAKDTMINCLKSKLLNKKAP